MNRIPANLFIFPILSSSLLLPTWSTDIEMDGISSGSAMVLICLPDSVTN